MRPLNVFSAGGRGGLLLLAAWLAVLSSSVTAGEPSRPNILWISCEDISPNLGCYGDAYAVTPNLDRLASQGVRYTHAFAAIGVCAPSRSTIITGVYSPSLGTQHMRCQGTPPDFVKCLGTYLRDAGYYCTNHQKTDYNFPVPPEAWDASDKQAQWRNRPRGKPFFAVFNFTTCHESQIRLDEAAYQKRTKDFTAAERHDPAQAKLPPYHPDTPEVRRDWARYADMITYMDKQAGEVLKQLEADGLADDTIVVFFSDHGAGMPRSKRWLYDSSMRVPLIVRFPAKYAALAPSGPGTTCDRLVSFVDYAPTMLSLVGVKIPEHMQGVAFLGTQQGPERQYVFGFRDRMDCRYDMQRSVRDHRYNYIRNYHPELPWFHHQHMEYLYAMPTMQVWQRLADQGKLTGDAATFMADSKPVEELYDVENDPWELQNLATQPEHRERLERMRAEHRKWQQEVIDLSLLTESDMRTRFGATPTYGTPTTQPPASASSAVAEYAAVRREPQRFPLAKIAAAADLANQRDPAKVSRLSELLTDADPAVRYWAAIGLVSLGQQAGPATEALLRALDDAAPSPRIAAAEALCHLGHADRAVPVLVRALGPDTNEWARLEAACVLDRIDQQATKVLATLKATTADSNSYVREVARHAVRDLDPQAPEGQMLPVTK